MDKTAIAGAVNPSLKLPPQQFAEILSGMRSIETNASDEKRRTTRMVVSAKVIISTYDGKALGRGITVLARDLSMKGIGILSAIEIKLNELFVAHLPRPHMHVSHLICQVVFVGKMAEGLFNLGCRFNSELPTDQILAQV